MWSEVRSLAPLYYWYVTVCVIWSQITCSPLLLVCHSVCDLKSDHLLPFIIGMSQCVWSEVRSLAPLYYWYVTVCVIWSQITCSPLLLVCNSVCDLKSDHLLPFIIGMSQCVWSEVRSLAPLYYWYVTVCVIWSQITCSPLLLVCHSCWSQIPLLLVCQCVWSEVTCSPLLLVCHSVCDLKSDHLLPFIIGMSQCVWSEVRSLAPLYYWYVTVCVIWSQITCSSFIIGMSQCVWSEVRSLAPLYYWYVTVCVIWSQITCSPLLLVCNSVCDLKSDHLLPFIIGMSQCVWSEVRSLAPLYYWYVTVCVIWSQITCSPLLLVCHSVCDLKSDHLLPFIIGMSQCVWSEVRSLKCSPLLLVCNSVCDLKSDAPLYYWYVRSDSLLPFIIGMSQCVWSEVRSLAPLYYWYVTVCVIWSQITCSPLLLVCNSVCDLKSDHLLPFIIGMSQCVWSEVRSLAPLYYWYVTVCVIWSQITCSPLLLVCHSVCDLKSDHLLPFIIGM